MDQRRVRVSRTAASRAIAARSDIDELMTKKATVREFWVNDSTCPCEAVVIDSRHR